jgi:3-dehydroquinate synthetase
MDQTLELLLSRIEDQRKQVLINLGDGAAKDFASYSNMTGYIRGLSVAESIIKDLAQRMETFEDE